MKKNTIYNIDIINEKINKINNLLKNINFNNKKYLFLLSKYKKLYKIKNYYDNYIKYFNELKNVKLLINDNELKSLVLDEIKKLNKLVNYYFSKFKNKINLLNNDKKDNLNVYLEIHAGVGGNEASLFVLDLFKMYVKYSELMKWKVELININGSILNGYKEILCKIIGKNVYKKLKYESGGHRVQRVPITESQGRVHTSTCLVAVIPDIKDNNSINVNFEDIKIDTFRSSGAGGQHVNTTDSAVRLTHIPTGIVVECQQERSQHKNKSRALQVLKARINNLILQKKHEKEYNIKKKLLGTGLRNDRNRTYNYIQNRITDHRINFSIHSLSDVLNGNLNLLIDHLIKFYKN